MTPTDAEQHWSRLERLLRPIHKSSLVTARRLACSDQAGDDLYQEAVLRAFAKLDTLRDENKFKSWFFAVLTSVHRSRFATSFWRRFLPLDGTDRGRVKQRDQTPFPDEEFERAARVQRALGVLRPKQREAVVLFEIEGFSIAEVATLQKSSPSAVKSRLKRGRERLRRHYEKMGWFRERKEMRVLDTHEVPQGGKL